MYLNNSKQPARQPSQVRSSISSRLAWWAMSDRQQTARSFSTKDSDIMKCTSLHFSKNIIELNTIVKAVFSKQQNTLLSS